MASSREYLDFVLEQLEGISGIDYKRMRPVVCYFDEDMSFILRIVIIRVNYTNCIIQLHAVFESKTASRKNCEHPS